MMKLNIRQITYISLILHIICSVFSTGFQHFDEHFQIYEFMNYKLGEIPSSNLPWEFREQIRPWFQVFVYYHIRNFFSLIGLDSPFHIAYLFRLITSLFGLYALTRFIPLIKQWFQQESQQRLAWALLNLAWFVPYIQTRTNSESFGISFFLLGFSYFVGEKVREKNLIKSAFLAGIFFGLSYLSRSQMAASVAFVWFWAVFIGKYSFKELATSAVAIVLMILSGIVFDFWGYGEWTFSTWHYFRTNVLEGVLDRSGRHPFYWYVRWCFLRGIPPVSLPLILATLYGWWKYRKEALTWALAALFIFQSIIGHKELRYIFPVIILSPLYIAFFYRDYKEKVDGWFTKGWVRGLARFVVGVNFLFLAISILRPANPSVKFYKHVYDREDIQKIYFYSESPFTMLGLPISYYRKKDFVTEEFKDLNQLFESKKDQGEFFVFYNRGHYIFEMEKNTNCKLDYLTYPRWSINYNVGNWLSRSRVWSLYKCKSN